MKQMSKSAAFAHLVGANEIAGLEAKNIYFKHTLAETLMSDTHKEQLDYFEYFQNRFLQLDEKIGLLKIDMTLFETPSLYPLHMTQHLNNEPQGLAYSIKTRYDMICCEIQMLEKEFKHFLQETHPL
ncbi:hypothetical protein GA0116948_11854 [Chitinophaga costaii]|uniref:Uncharacterized protein n=1 Tax=Chitinophaga costaii TaxID=1335309 RepID=A0A1C4FYT0_9BACT|nr:hypothetical protein [Chitinophaga costaii]PUZ20927.1 hypothetical protein DCM91_17510 [Chitinophaga costaii]SCC61042.1 hypothetical protein GA0116948_11854 [Chitinophaga costaii]